MLEWVTQLHPEELSPTSSNGCRQVRTQHTIPSIDHGGRDRMPGLSSWPLSVFSLALLVWRAVLLVCRGLLSSSSCMENQGEVNSDLNHLVSFPPSLKEGKNRLYVFCGPTAGRPTAITPLAGSLCGEVFSLALLVWRGHTGRGQL